MRPLALAALLCLPAMAEDRVVGSSLDDAWRRAIQVLALKGLQITSSDRAAGVIQAEREDGADETWFECPRGSGSLLLRGYKVVVIVESRDPSATNVRVTATGVNTWYQNRHLAFLKIGRVTTQVTCTSSSGVLEEALLSQIAGPVS